MLSLEIPPLWLMVVEFIAGIVLGLVFPAIAKAITFGTLAGFIVGLYFVFSNPTTDLNAVSFKIEFVMFFLVNTLLHSLFFDAGAGLIESIRQANSRRG